MRPRRHARYGRVPPRDPLYTAARILFAALVIYFVAGALFALLELADW